MIVYNLGCANDHSFEGWFSSADDFERQTTSKLLSCPLCGNGRISRLPHAPYVNTPAERPAEASPPGKGVPHQYANVGAELLGGTKRSRERQILRGKCFRMQ